MTVAYFIVQIHDTTKRWLRPIFAITKSHSSKWIYTLTTVGCLILIATIGFQTSMMRAFREQEGSHDVPYNPWIPATVNGLAICLYITLLSILVIWSIRSFSKNLAILCCSITLVGYTLFDLGVIFYYPLHLVAKCSLSDFHGIMRNCREEFNDVLMVIRRGSTPITLTILGVLHGFVIAFSLASTVAIVLKRKKVKYEVNGRGNGYAARIPSGECYTDSINLELK
ncbi:hypothetical protein GHT06_021688 [Daphnia sinensis]|uniref:Uncharacterized protein n=1 Tax=Daphnia sinensis TaxID=1820382 RepID=A0AAD5PQB6_9CRUS|nr:hypothetical protein GHT06_021688 [Daphnia sinensis]